MAYTMFSASGNSVPSSKPAKFTVAICGGGIAGLTLAIGLQKMSGGDVRVDIYEAAREYAEIGVGVGLLKRPWQVLKRLGLAEDLSECARVPRNEDEPKLIFDIRKSDKPKGMRYYRMLVPFGIVGFHRASFQKVLASHLDANVIKTHFSKRLVYYKIAEPSNPASHGPIELHFEDASSTTCDVLIGADGIKSPTRRCLLESFASNIAESNPRMAEQLLSSINPVWSGSISYRAVIPRESLVKVNPDHRALKESQLYTGENKHLTCYPITSGSTKLVNVAAVCSSPEKEYSRSNEEMVVRPGNKEEIQSQFAGWETELLQLLECLETTTRWPINTLMPLPTCSHDRVAIMGDAAHAMMPYQASGAGQAIEDAYVLASVLAHPKTTLATVPTALKAYEAVRLEHANEVHRRSRMNGQLIHFEPETAKAVLQEWSPGGGESRKEGAAIFDGTPEMLFAQGDATELGHIGAAMFEGWKWSWTTDVEDDLQRAIAMLAEQPGPKASTLRS